jgi:hypothetical protein
MSSSNTLTINLTPIGNTIDFYFTWIIVPIGFVTNAISILVFARTKLLKTNMGYFNLLLSISNLLTLLFYFFVYKSSTVLNLDLSVQTLTGCKLFMFIRRVLRELSPIIETVMTLDRFLSINYPKKFPILKNKVINRSKNNFPITNLI